MSSAAFTTLHILNLFYEDRITGIINNTMVTIHVWTQSDHAKYT